MNKEEPNTRFAVNLPSKSQAQLITSWASCTGRTTSSLVVYLLETALLDALEKGHVPQRAIKEMNAYEES